jgi:hypothetical protein
MSRYGFLLTTFQSSIPEKWPPQKNHGTPSFEIEQLSAMRSYPDFSFAVRSSATFSPISEKVIMSSPKLWKIQQDWSRPHSHQTSPDGRRGNDAPIHQQLLSQPSRADHLFTVNSSQLHLTTREKSSCHPQNSGSYSVPAPTFDQLMSDQLRRTTWKCCTNPLITPATDKLRR